MNLIKSCWFFIAFVSTFMLYMAYVQLFQLQHCHDFAKLRIVSITSSGCAIIRNGISLIHFIYVSQTLFLPGCLHGQQPYVVSKYLTVFSNRWQFCRLHAEARWSLLGAILFAVGPWVDFPWVQPTRLLSLTFLGKLWSDGRTTVDIISPYVREVARHSRLYEFSSSASTLTRSVAAWTLRKIPFLPLVLEVVLFHYNPRIVRTGRIGTETNLKTDVLWCLNGSANSSSVTLHFTMMRSHQHGVLYQTWWC